ncbi:MAG: hypothetical protein CL681_04695 [Blastopirellula sp.]|nr:hypothetical protein [Blastopirellula sp.]
MNFSYSPDFLRVSALLLVVAASLPCAADDTQKDLEQVVTKAIRYLRTKGVAADGSYSRQAGIGVTALATTGLLRHGVPADDPVVAKSLKHLEGFVQADGGIYESGTFYRNYETCLVVLCFKEANADGRYDAVIRKADGFVQGIQWGADEGADESDLAYGGSGYGKHKRPDLSNTSFFVDALRAAGHGEESEAMQRAVTFISRCQNLETEHNTTPFAAKVEDGGFYYTVAAGGDSKSGKTANGGLRSYGGMTYAGLKSMIYAGVKRDDPRVQAAVKWVRQHYDLSTNPGMGDAGLYYYYHIFAKALSALSVDKFTDARGQQHDWQAELIETLAVRQQADGAWTNGNARWFEGDPNLATAYALLALSYCRR